MEPYNRFKKLVVKKSYDAQNSLSLAIASQLAYKDRATIKTTVESWNYTFVEQIVKEKGKDIDTQCFIMSDSTDIVVVFRGTDSLQDWFANFQASTDPGPFHDTKAHEGFQDSLYPAVIALTRHVRDAEKEKKRIWITGHSLGGALASLYAGMLLENGLIVYGLYTFASPRPGSSEFADTLDEKIKGPHHRVVNDGDIVPHVPPEPFFTHPGKRKILKSIGSTSSKRTWWMQRVDALRHFVANTGNKFDIKDNHVLMGDDESYIPRLIRLVEAENDPQN